MCYIGFIFQVLLGLNDQSLASNKVVTPARHIVIFLVLLNDLLFVYIIHREAIHHVVCPIYNGRRNYVRI